jgi:putative transposase
LVEESSLPICQTVAQLGISRATFYRWYQRYLARGVVVMEDSQPIPRWVWNKLPEAVVTQLSSWPYKSLNWCLRGR